MSEKGWPVAETLPGFLQQISKEMSHQERRPGKPSAASLLGPGMAAFATRLLDWDSPAARFNGFWISEDAANQPQPGVLLGLTIASRDGRVVQIALSHDVDAGKLTHLYVRRLRATPSTTPTSLAWEQVYPELPEGAIIFVAEDDADPTGWNTRSGVTAPPGLRPVTRTVV